MYLVKYASSGVVAARFLHRNDAKDFILNNDDLTLLIGLYVIEKYSLQANIEKEKYNG